MGANDGILARASCCRKPEPYMEAIPEGTENRGTKKCGPGQTRRLTGTAWSE
jgi:hypothetical protein